MSDPIPHSDDPKIQAKIDKAVHHNSLVDYTLRWLLHYIERIIAVMTILALLGALGVEIYHMIASGAAYFADVETMLHHILNIVVGLEFVRMLIDTTPANILEVLTVAITRHVVLSHDDPWSNVACIACIAGLFAIRRFLIRRSELKEEMVEDQV
ncbi:MAG: hypothetical protein EGQ87_03395 [Clostridiales bacterium]|nr:hypothetical protein [Clostridiales bacterium]